MNLQPTTYNLKHKKTTRGIVVGCWSFVVGQRSGQSLAEVMVGLAIGAILIGAASFAITTALKTNLSAQRSQFAANLAQETTERARSYASADWQNIYGLTKGSSTPYYFVATSTQFLVVQGTEGIVENDIRNGLVGQWGFDEATGTLTYDSTGNKNSGTLTNNPTRATSTCKIGNCISFDGVDDYISSSQAISFGVGSFSVGLWMKATGTSAYNAIFDEGSPVNSGISGYQLFLSGGYLRYNMSDGIGHWQELVVGGSPDLRDNKWHHVVWTYDASNSRFYLDSVLLDTDPWNYGTGNSAAQFLIAKSWVPTFNGIFDDVRVYNRALSADEVKQLFNSNVYSRLFYVENACRTTDASSTYSGVAPCGGGSVDDPSSQKVTAVVSWGTGFGSGQVVLSDMLTRWKNAIFQQSDWSGGISGNILINSGTTFASSSNINYGGGSLRINGL